MFNKTAFRPFTGLLLFIGISLISLADDNLCHTTKAGSCHDQIEWQIGYFWARHEPSAASCASYFHTFGANVGDIWGFCNEFGMPGSDVQAAEPQAESEAEAELVFLLTSRYHPMPSGNAEPCPFEGLDPIINYEENTFVCATGF